MKRSLLLLLIFLLSTFPSGCAGDAAGNPPSTDAIDVGPTEEAGGTPTVAGEPIESPTEEAAGTPTAADASGEPRLTQGLFPFQIVDTKTFPLGEEGREYLLRSANVGDIDGDGSAEAVITVNTNPDQLPEPIIILGAESEIVDLTHNLFPQGVPRLKIPPYILFPDLNGDGRTDLVISESGREVPTPLGSRMLIALQDENGHFDDVSPQIPEELWATGCYATAVGDLDGDGRPEVLYPAQLEESKTTLLTWQDGTFSARRNWIAQELWGRPEELGSHTNLQIADLDLDGRQDVIVGGGWALPSLRIVFGGPGGFTAENLLTLPDGVFGHTAWDEWKQEDTPTSQGADVIGLIVADFDNDGLKDIFAAQEQILGYKPGTVTDTGVLQYQELYDHGGWIGSNMAIQVFKNQGNREFTDVTPATAGLLGLRYYEALIPIDLNGDGFLDIVGGYWTKWCVGQENRLWGSTVFLNDGTGVFQVVEGSELFPTMETDRSETEQLGMFLPTSLTPGRLEGLFVASESDWQTGTLTVRKGVYEGTIGTGPGFADSAELGYPGFNEFYYLRTHPDAQSAVLARQYATGLEHYKGVGIRRGYQAFAANATVRGSEGEDTLILPLSKADVQISKTNEGWQLVDGTGKYGTLKIKDVEAIQFLDGEKSL